MVFDASLGRQGIIVASFGYSPWIDTEETEWEHEILYDDGTIDTAYEQELEVVI